MAITAPFSKFLSGQKYYVTALGMSSVMVKTV